MATKIFSWNVNGLRAALNKDFVQSVTSQDPDIVCLQETKMSGEYASPLPGYNLYHLNAEKKGYSGVAILSKSEPLAISYGLGKEEHDHEGRVIIAEYPDWYLLCVYTPNSKRGLPRLPYRQTWDRDFLQVIKDLERDKPVIFCGDLNVAHKEIDIKHPSRNRKNAGFTDEERSGFTTYIDNGFIDTFREFNTEPDNYSWWSYMGGARKRNVGWRLDYVVISQALRPRLTEAAILPDIMGSDHCPVYAVID